MDEDMGIIYRAIDENYKIVLQFRYTWNMLQKFSKFRYKIWKNFTYFIDWMEKNFAKEKLYEIMNKSYELEDSILCRIQKTESKAKSAKEVDKTEEKKFETWLMSNIFRHVENPQKEINPEQKYVGKVKFTKIYKKYAGGEYETWIPPKSYKEYRKPVADIQIVVYLDDKPRRYERELGCKPFKTFDRIFSNSILEIPGGMNFDPVKCVKET